MTWECSQKYIKKTNYTPCINIDSSAKQDTSIWIFLDNMWDIVALEFDTFASTQFVFT